MGTTKTAKDKLIWLNNVIMKAVEGNFTLSHSETCFQFCLVFGSTKRYFNDLLEHFIDRGLITVEKGEIIPNDMSKVQK